MHGAEEGVQSRSRGQSCPQPCGVQHRAGACAGEGGAEVDRQGLGHSPSGPPARWGGELTRPQPWAEMRGRGLMGELLGGGGSRP